MKLFFDWHALDKKHLTNFKFRMMAALTLICALLMLFITELTRFPTSILGGFMIAALLVGLFALLLDVVFAKGVLLASLLIIEYAAFVSVSSPALIAVFLVLDAVLACLLMKNER